MTINLEVWLKKSRYDKKKNQCVRGIRRSKKSILTDFEILAKKKSQISLLYSQSQKWPKIAKIRKSSKIDQKVSKMSFFWCLSDWELKCFWLGGFCDDKIDFRRISKFWPKKNLKSVYSTVKVKNGQNT